MRTSGIDSLLRISDPGQPRAILQLLVYCEAYHQLTGTPRSLLRPMIFKFKDMELTEFPMLKVGKSNLENYGQVADEFREKFCKIMERMFDLGEPITEADDPRCCTYCKLNGKICRY